MDLSFIQILWFILIAVLWVMYLALEGFGFGSGMLLKVLPRNEKEKRLVVNAIGPHWDGNEVWVLTAGGATFAAFPEWYATMFSGMYLALVLILLCLIVRICAIEWRGKVDSEPWRNAWDWAHSISAWIVSILWGVAFANLVQGMKIEVGHYEAMGKFVAIPAKEVTADVLANNQHFLTGGFFSLLTPFTILGGLVTLTLFFTHGALFLALKTAGEFHDRAAALAAKASVVSLVVTAVWAIWAQFMYSEQVLGFIPLALAAVLLVLVTLFAAKGNLKASFISSCLSLAMAVVFIWFAVFPYAMKSSIDPNYGLTLAQASATAPTQTVMTIAAVIFVPIVLAYTVWSYSIFTKKMSVADVPDKTAGLDPKHVRAFA